MSFKHLARLVGLVMAVALLVAQGVPARIGAQDDEKQSYTSPDGIISFEYPQGWFVEADENFFSFVAVANTENAAGILTGSQSEEEASEEDESDPAINSGEVALAIFGPTMGGFLFESEGGEEAETLLEYAEMVATQTTENNAEDDTPVTLGEPEEITIGDFDAVRVPVSDDEVEGYFIVIDYEGTFVIMIAYAAPGEIGQWEETLNGIIETVSFAETGTYNAADTGLSVTYPSDWIAFDSGFSGLFVTNNIGAAFSPEVASGDVVISVLAANATEIYGVTADMPAAEAMTMLKSVLDTQRAVTSGDAAEGTVGDYSGLRADFSSDTLEGFYFLGDVGDQRVFITVVTAAGELEAAGDTIDAVISSLTPYTPPAE